MECPRAHIFQSTKTPLSPGCLLCLLTAKQRHARQRGGGVALTVLQILFASAWEAFPYTSPTGTTLDRAFLWSDRHPSSVAAWAARICPGSGAVPLGSSLDKTKENPERWATQRKETLRDQRDEHLNTSTTKNIVKCYGWRRYNTAHAACGVSRRKWDTGTLHCVYHAIPAAERGCFEIECKANSPPSPPPPDAPPVLHFLLFSIFTQPQKFPILPLMLVKIPRTIHNKPPPTYTVRRFACCCHRSIWCLRIGLTKLCWCSSARCRLADSWTSFWCALQRVPSRGRIASQTPLAPRPPLPGQGMPPVPTKPRGVCVC